MFLYCRFDSIIVFSADYDPRAPEGPTITFVVPPFIEGKKEVELAFSADGLTFEPFGKFVYHGERRRFMILVPVYHTRTCPACMRSNTATRYEAILCLPPICGTAQQSHILVNT